MDFKHSISLTIPNASSDQISEASQQLIDELNSIEGRVAARKTEKRSAGTKGDPVTLGAIVLAAVSAGLAKEIAQTLVAYINRNPKYVVQVGRIKITKDYASSRDVRAINDIAAELNDKHST